MMSRSLSSYMVAYNPLYPLCHSTEVFAVISNKQKKTWLMYSLHPSLLLLRRRLLDYTAACHVPPQFPRVRFTGLVCMCVCRDHNQAPREGGQIILSHNMRCPFVHRTQRKAIIAHFLDSSPIRVLYRHRFLRASFSGSFLSVSLPPVRTILLH